MIRERASPPQCIAFDLTGIPNPRRELRCIPMERLQEEATVCAKTFFIGLKDRFQEFLR